MNPKLFTEWWESPIGWMEVQATPNGVSSICFKEKFIPIPGANTHSIIHETLQQLEAYFAGRRTVFNLPLDFRKATDFEIKVWQQLMKIPFGVTTTYSAIAERMGKPNAARAVGRANGANPLAVVVPCHRLIGKDQKLRGYAYGLDRKSFLLEHEAQFAKVF